MSHTVKKGLLLINLGTPDQPEPKQVKAYLKEFLMDPYVVDIPYLLRWLLVNAVILQTRPKKSSEAYKKVWTTRGSPLLHHHLDLSSKVKKLLEKETHVIPAMRYGNPSIEKALHEFAHEGITELTIFPLYPQYSLAATETSLQHALKLSQKILPGAKIKMIRDFFDSPDFLNAFAETAREDLAKFNADYVLFSFHGLPERHVKKTDLSQAHCLMKEGCCDQITEVNRNCYRAQSFHTAHELAKRLGLPKEKYAVSFQSRLGRTPWIKPYTDELYESLPKKGYKKIAVLCPAFVADCLETLEEIAIRGREDFVKFGGEDLKLIPSLNSSDQWAAAVVALAAQAKSENHPA